MKLRYNNINQIIQARQEQITLREQLSQSGIKHSDQENNIAKVSSLLKKDILNSQDRDDFLHEIQQKYRISFTARFPLEKVQWLIVGQKVMIERGYNPQQKSYYLLKGKISIYAENNGLRRTYVRQRVLEVVQGQSVLGMVFKESSYGRCNLVAQNAVLLVIPHLHNTLNLIERDILMTTTQKRQFLNKFKLFDEIETFQKYHFPHIEPVKFSKGDHIYQRGDYAKHIYLIVQGQIVLWTTLEVPQETGKSATVSITQLIKPRFKEQQSIPTEIVTSGSYFGEEEVLIKCQRRQAAICKGTTCLLLAVPIYTVNKLLKEASFRQSLQSASQQRQFQRNNKIISYKKLKVVPSSVQSDLELQQKFDKFKTKMHRNLTEQSQKVPIKISFRKSNNKIMHGHSFKLGNESPQKEQKSFSMLEVDQLTYSSTFKRYRHSLKQIQISRQPKVRIQLNKGRSLDQFCTSLKLNNLFKGEVKQTPKARIYHENVDAKQHYETCYRRTKRIKQNHNCQPRSFIAKWKLKKEYLDYLQSLL